jgi:protein-tyrosine phosphatase
MEHAIQLVRSVRGRLECLRALATARRDSHARLREVPVSRLLLICHGNIYRSAFVAAYLARHPIAGVRVRSAGLHPVANRECPPRHVAMSQKYGVDLRSHRSRVLTQGDLDWAQLIVLMDRHNWQSLVEAGADRKRLIWLGALDGGAIEIPDPYGMEDTQAQRIVGRLAECSKVLAAKLAGSPSEDREG